MWFANTIAIATTTTTQEEQCQKGFNWLTETEGEAGEVDVYTGGFECQARP